MAINLNRKGVGLSGENLDKENKNLDLIEEEFKRVGNAVPVANEAKAVATEAKTTAQSAEVVAKGAESKINGVKSEFDAIVAEAGSNNPEVVQARGGEVNLNARLVKAAENLAETASQVNVAGIANAQFPLYIPTYDGSNQSTHPKVLKLDTAFGGWKWWLAYTPYPTGDDDYENPSIAYSGDGVTWYPITVNPIDKPTAAETAAGGFMSDAHIFIKNEVMECWYRYATNSNDVKIFRKTSTDGLTWTARELMIDCTLTGERVVAPAVLFEGNMYKMWYINQDRYIMYDESADGFTWANKRKLNVPHIINGFTAWHLDVTKTDLGYEFVCNYTKGAEGDLYYWKSSDNATFSQPVKIITPSKDDLAWDNSMIYRASLVKEGAYYKIYYSAVSRKGKWHIGLSSGTDVTKLKGASMLAHVDNDLFLQNSLFMGADRAIAIGDARYRRNKIEFRSSGLGANVELTAADEVSFRNAANTDFANFKAKKVTLTGDLVTPTNVDARKMAIQFLQMSLLTTGLASSAGLLQYDNASKILSFHDGVRLYHLNAYIRDVPASSTSPGVRGSWTADANYMYVCQNTNQWIRIAKDSTW